VAVVAGVGEIVKRCTTEGSIKIDSEDITSINALFECVCGAARGSNPGPKFKFETGRRDGGSSNVGMWFASDLADDQNVSPDLVTAKGFVVGGCKQGSGASGVMVGSSFSSSCAPHSLTPS
jgi:hypothetical protein